MGGNGLIKRLLNWLDEHLLLVLVGFLLAFIPLYPKIPLADIIPGYQVRLRLEDVFIALTLLWYGIQVLRKKAEWRTPVTLFVVLYAISGLLSVLSGVLLVKTIPAETLHWGKSLLHWGRYMQYFSVFFLAYGAIRKPKDLQILLGIVVVTLLGVALYGYGQKFYFWPVYSTMNREFAKGVPLILGEFARVQSTFAGHYDLGAYLVVVIPILVGAFYALANPWKKNDQWRNWLRSVLVIAWLGGLWLMAVSASRTSYVGMLLGSGLTIGLLMLTDKKWWVGIKRGATVLFISLAIVLVVGELPSRFAQLIDQSKYPKIHDTYHAINDYLTHPGKLIGIQPKPPANSITVDEIEKQLNEAGLTRSDTQPTPANLPSDVHKDIPIGTIALDDPAATNTANLIRVGDTYVVQRTFSECALSRSLSLCIRLETLWPRAIAGFLRNPLVGSGYATLNKESVYQFTEAESTDNNFLRTLGETGVLGFFFFYGTVGVTMWFSWRYLWSDQQDSWLRHMAAAGMAGAAGLLLNALYIDVFAASKVAYVFWLWQGALLAAIITSGGIGRRWHFSWQNQKNAADELKKLLQAAEGNSKQATKSGPGSAYLSASSSKRRLRSTKPRRGQ